ncbi:MAG: ATP-binding cassette domain-containing protein [Phycisphaerales bacterium]|nr:MAG: ATP-binding cassette domain-containing protein [Phycisphaerales bacterium]
MTTLDHTPAVGDVAIRASGLGKCYHVYEKPHHRLMQFTAGGRKAYYREVWALRGVSLELRRGACFGIVGRNGAGKTTLLQMIAGVLTPTEGEVEVFGRLTALLELGSGFHRDFTGRENVFMAGALLGLSKREMEEKFDKVAGFADIGEFMNRAVRTYSKGMYARLAFAVYANLDPDIFIVDEALAVGDAAFRHRCMYRFREMRDRGVTMLYVSHDAASMKQFCDEVLWIDGGVLRDQGEAGAVTRAYLNDLFGVTERTPAATPRASDAAPEPAPNAKASPDPAVKPATETAPEKKPAPGPEPASLAQAVAEAETVDDAEAEAVAAAEAKGPPEPVFEGPEASIPGGDDRTGDGRAVIEGVGLYDARGRASRVFRNGETMLVRVTCRNVSLDPAEDGWVLGYTLRNFKGQDISGFNTLSAVDHLAPPPPGASRTHRFEIELPALHPGDYALTVAVAGWSPGDDRPVRADRIENALVLKLACDKRVHNLLAMETVFVEEADAGGSPESVTSDQGGGASMPGARSSAG